MMVEVILILRVTMQISFRLEKHMAFRFWLLTLTVLVHYPLKLSSRVALHQVVKALLN